MGKKGTTALPPNDPKQPAAKAMMATVRGDLAQLTSIIEALSADDRAALVAKNYWEGGSSLLHMACVTDQREIVQYLVSQGADPNCRNDTRHTPFLISANRASLPLTVWLATEGGADVRAVDRTGAGAVHVAAIEGKLDTLEFLVCEAGLPVDARAGDRDGSTPLKLAIIQNQLDAAKWLTQHGADPNWVGHDGVPLIYTACVNSASMATIAWLSGTGDGDGRANVNAPNEHGATVVTWCCGTGNFELLKLLASNGADLHVRASNSDGGAMDITPLLVAVRQGNHDIASWLLAQLGFKESGDLDLLETVTGSTPLFFAAENGDLRMVKLLVEHGARVDHVGPSSVKEPATPLHIAAQKGFVEITKVLVGAGADPGMEVDGANAVFLAAHSKQHEILDFLATRGPDPEAAMAQARQFAMQEHMPLVAAAIQSAAIRKAPDTTAAEPLAGGGAAAAAQLPPVRSRLEQAQTLKKHQRKDRMLYIPRRCEVEGCECKVYKANGGSLQRCSRCTMVCYCSVEHQKADWKRHKKECKKLKQLGLWGCVFDEKKELARFPIGSQSEQGAAPRAEDTPGPDDVCGICGSKSNLERTPCCGNWICNNEEEYVMFSYSRQYCNRSHRRYTMCGYHHNEGHDGDDWRTCEECKTGMMDDGARSWYSTNGYNFTPGFFSAYPKGSMITAECGQCKGRMATGFEGHSYNPGVGTVCMRCATGARGF